MKLLVAPKTRTDADRAAVPESPTAESGRHLASISGCHGCDAFGLSGGAVEGPRGIPAASNLTPAGLSGWTEQDFVSAMRTGHRPGGSMLHEFMPWQ